MNIQQTHTVSLLIGAGIAAAALVLTSLMPVTAQISTPGPVPSPGSCFAFTTIDQGQYSGFGYYCQPGVPSGGAAAAVIGPSASTCYANVAQPEVEAIIRNECAWIDFWTEHSDNVFPAPPVPAVDFSRYVVVAVISGTRSNGCFGIEITHIDSTSCGGRTIHVRERVPCAGQLCTLALTNNFHFIKVCKEFLPQKLPVCFEHRLMSPTCSITAACAVPVGG
jgi:hypothetical protein